MPDPVPCSVGCLRTLGNSLLGLFNKFGSTLCSLCTLVCKVSYLVCNNGEAFAVLTGSCGFNCGIKSKDIGLEGNVFNGLYDVSYLIGGVVDVVHCGGKTVHFFVCLVDLARGLVDKLSCLCAVLRGCVYMAGYFVYGRCKLFNGGSLFAAALMTTQALAASFLHLIVHSVVKIMAFFTAGAVLHYAHREYVPQLEGLGRYMPVTFACFTAAACALTGIPPFNGFVSKWYIARAAVDIGGWLPLVGFAALLVSALLTAVYMFQVVLKAWFPRTEAPAIPEGSAHEAGWMMTVPTAILAAACLVMGLFPQWLLDVIGKAVGL